MAHWWSIIQELMMKHWRISILRVGRMNTTFGTTDVRNTTSAITMAMTLNMKIPVIPVLHSKLRYITFPSVDML